MKLEPEDYERVLPFLGPRPYPGHPDAEAQYDAYAKRMLRWLRRKKVGPMPSPTIAKRLTIS
jgi:hypothetical protein